jgi:hypothetical protein
MIMRKKRFKKTEKFTEQTNDWAGSYNFVSTYIAWNGDTDLRTFRLDTDLLFSEKSYSRKKE